MRAAHCAGLSDRAFGGLAAFCAWRCSDGIPWAQWHFGITVQQKTCAGMEVVDGKFHLGKGYRGVTVSKNDDPIGLDVVQGQLGLRLKAAGGAKQCDVRRGWGEGSHEKNPFKQVGIEASALAPLAQGLNKKAVHVICISAPAQEP